MTLKSRFWGKGLEEQLYRIGLFTLPIAIAFGIVFFELIYPSLRIPCVFRAVTGMYCPGCGGTRAVYELLHGHILHALWYHPFVVYSVFFYLLFMISHTFKLFFSGRFGRKIRGMRFRAWYLFGALGILALNFVVRNFLFLVYGIEL